MTRHLPVYRPARGCSACCCRFWRFRTTRRCQFPPAAPKRRRPPRRPPSAAPPRVTIARPAPPRGRRRAGTPPPPAAPEGHWARCAGRSPPRSRAPACRRALLFAIARGETGRRSRRQRCSPGPGPTTPPARAAMPAAARKRSPTCRRGSPPARFPSTSAAMRSPAAPSGCLPQRRGRLRPRRQCPLRGALLALALRPHRRLGTGHGAVSFRHAERGLIYHHAVDGGADTPGLRARPGAGRDPLPGPPWRGCAPPAAAPCCCWGRAGPPICGRWVAVPNVELRLRGRAPAPTRTARDVPAQPGAARARR